MVLLVLILICLLGHDSFSVRERATLALRQHVDLCPGAVIAAESARVPEISQRATMIASAWIKAHRADLVDHELPNNWVRWPWIDMYPEAAYEFTDHWLRATAPPGPDGVAGNYDQSSKPHWPAWRAASRLWAMEQVASRISIRETIRAMCMNEIAWCQRQGVPAPPEPEWDDD